MDSFLNYAKLQESFNEVTIELSKHIMSFWMLVVESTIAVESILKKVFDTIYFPSREFQENRKRQKEKSEEEHAPLLEPALIHSATVNTKHNSK